jgi:hypothetical protein
MGEHSKFLNVVKQKFNRRSHSSPPDSGSQRGLPEWQNLAVEYQPVPPPAVRTAPSQPEPLPTRDPYARYDPRAYHSIPQHRHTVPRKATRQSATPAPLLQLPKPRSTWRRSLEDLSPTKRAEGWDMPSTATTRPPAWDEPERQTRMTVDLACALPPQYFDQPPQYESVQHAAKDLHTSNPWTDWQQQSVPHITTTAPRDYHRHHPVRDHDAIDDLLQHPLLRPR